MRCVRRGAGAGAGRGRAELLRPGRAFAAGDAAAVPGAVGVRGRDGRTGAVRDAHPGRSGGEDRGRGPGPGEPGAAGTPRPGAAVVRSAAAVVPGPDGGPEPHLQHAGRAQPVRAGRRDRPQRRTARCAGAARGAAHGVPRPRRRAVPARTGHEGGRRGSAVRPRRGRGADRGTGRDGERPRVRPVAGDTGTGAADLHRPGHLGTGGGVPPHRGGRLVHGTARPGHLPRLHGPARGPPATVGAAARAVRRLHTLATATAGRRRRSGQPVGGPGRLLAAGTGRRTAGAGPAGRPDPAGASLLPGPHGAPRHPRGRTRRTRRAGPRPGRHPVHGGPVGAGGAAVPARRRRRHPDRHRGGRPHRPGPRRTRRLLRQHPGAAHRSARRPHLHRASPPGTRTRPAGTREPGRALRTAGGTHGAATLHGTPPAVPGHAHRAEQRPRDPRPARRANRSAPRRVPAVQVRPRRQRDRGPSRRPAGGTARLGRRSGRPVRRGHRHDPHPAADPRTGDRGRRPGRAARRHRRAVRGRTRPFPRRAATVRRRPRRVRRDAAGAVRTASGADAASSGGRLRPPAPDVRGAERSREPAGQAPRTARSGAGVGGGGADGPLHGPGGGAARGAEGRRCLRPRGPRLSAGPDRLRTAGRPAGVRADHRRTRGRTAHRAGRCGTGVGRPAGQVGMRGGVARRPAHGRPARDGDGRTPGVCDLHVRVHGHPEGRAGDAPQRGDTVRHTARAARLRHRRRLVLVPLLRLRLLGVGDVGGAAARGPARRGALPRVTLTRRVPQAAGRGTGDRPVPDSVRLLRTDPLRGPRPLGRTAVRTAMGLLRR